MKTNIRSWWYLAQLFLEWVMFHTKLVEKIKTLISFNVHGSVHHKNILIYIQQDATLHSLFLSGNCSTCFGWYHHPSSGAQTTVSTASGICHTVTAICRYRAAAHLMKSWVRIPPGAWIFVCCECRVLSGRGVCDELITRPEESYRLWCVVVCDLETSRIGAPYIYIYIYIWH